MNYRKMIINAVIISIALESVSQAQSIPAEQSPCSTVPIYTSSLADNPVNAILDSIAVIQAMEAEGIVTDAALNDLASQLTSVSILSITDEFELLQLKAVINYASTILDTISVTIDNSEGYQNAISAVGISKALIDINNKDSSSYKPGDSGSIVTPAPSVTQSPSDASSPSPTQSPSDNSSPSVTQTPSATPGQSGTSASSTATVPAATPVPSTYIHDQINYRGFALTVEDVKSWNWKEGGTAQIGGYTFDIGISKTKGFLLIQNWHLQNYKTSDAEYIVDKNQWEDLPEFKYGKYKYKTYYDPHNYMLKRTSPMTLKSTDPDRPIAIAGDTFVDNKGKKTKLTALKYDYETVVGYGQKLDLYSGMRCEEGLLKPGGWGISWYGDSQYENDTYFVASNGEGHFSWDWHIIWTYEQSLAKKVKKPKANQIVGYWTKYNAKKKKWEWIGPEYDAYIP